MTHDAAQPRCAERSAHSPTTQNVAEMTCATCLRNLLVDLVQALPKPESAHAPDDFAARVLALLMDEFGEDEDTWTSLGSVDRIAAALAPPEPRSHVDIVFDGPPAPESGRFVEVEDPAGRSVSVGEWIDRGDGTWALRIPQHAAEPHAYAVEILWNSGTSHAEWRVETEDASLRETLDGARSVLDDMVKHWGYAEDQVRLAAITVVPAAPE